MKFEHIFRRNKKSYFIWPTKINEFSANGVNMLCDLCNITNIIYDRITNINGVQVYPNYLKIRICKKKSFFIIENKYIFLFGIFEWKISLVDFWNFQEERFKGVIPYFKNIFPPFMDGLFIFNYKLIIQ